jgi:hypothetical protein
MPRLGYLLKKLRDPQHPQQKTDIKREIAELLGPDVFFVCECRFAPAEEREEAVGEVEEVVAEEGLEPVGEGEEVVEDGEYLGQRVVRRVFPQERPRVRPPARLWGRRGGGRAGRRHSCDNAGGGAG